MHKKIFWTMGSIIIALITIIFILQSFKENDIEETGEHIDDTHQTEQEIIIFPEDDFDEVSFLYNQEDDGIVINKDDSGHWDVTNAEEKVSQSKVNQTIAIIQALVGTVNDSISVEDSKILDSNRNITLTNHSGDKKTLNVGAKSEDGSVYYTAFSDSENIYEVSAQLIDELPEEKVDLYDRSIIQVTPEKLNKIVIKNSIQTIELLPNSPYSEEEVRTNLSGWFMHQPYKHVYNVKYNQMEDMIYGIHQLEWTKMIHEENSDLTEYGLEDSNFQITFQSEDKEDTILIGAPATGTTHYAMLKGNQTVFTIDNQALHPYSYQAFDMIEKFVKIISVDVLKELRIQTLHGDDISIMIEHDGESDSNDLFQINGQTINEQDFRDVYKVIAGLSISEEVTDASYEIPEATMNYIILDKDDHEKEVIVEFVHYDDENFAVFIDEKADFMMKKEDFTHMIEQINHLL